LATAFINGVGYAAAAVGALLMLPQAVQSWRTRRVDDVSLGMIVLYMTNCLLWEIYGGLIHSIPVMVANGAGLFIGAWQSAMKANYRTRGR
jgi:MtN3 and saliva related transmembrane protein